MRSRRSWKSGDRLAVEGDDHVALLQAGLRAWAIGGDVADQGAFADGQSEGLGERGRDFLDA